MTERLGVARVNPPEITVVVPTFNHERYIRQTLLSILDQRIDVDTHVVVHDDASTDGTQEILRELYADFPDHLSVILQSENQTQLGVKLFANLLLHVESPYIALCEGDDLWTDQAKLKRQHDFMLANPWCILNHHAVTVANEGGNAEYERGLNALLSHPDLTQTRVAGVELARGNFIMSCSAMLRRDALRNDILAECAGLEDLFIFAVAAEAGDIGYLPEAMATYRLHSSNFWSGLSANERLSNEMETRWILASHLKGRMRSAFQDALIESLLSGTENVQLPSVARRAKEHSELLGAHRELEGAYRELEGANRELEGAHRELESAYRELEGAHRELEGAYRELEGANQELEVSRRAVSLRLDEAVEHVHAAEADLFAAAAASAALQASLDQVLRSRSWTVTKPLRAATTRLSNRGPSR